MAKSFSPFATWESLYRAAHDAVGVCFDANRAVFEVNGKDRTRFLHGMITNDVKNLAPGKAMVASILGQKGNVLAEIVVYNLGESFWVETDRATKEIAISTLSKYKVIDDVTFTDRSDAFTKFSVMGPNASDVLKKVGSGETRAWQTDVPLSPAWCVFVPSERVQEFQECLLKAGAVRLADDAAEAIRIESGIPKFGVDFGTENLPLEVPYLERGISFTKGCYIGQETIVRVAHRGGNVARRLMGIAIDADDPSGFYGAVVLEEGREVGTITSVSYSPRLQKVLGLAMVHRDAFSPATGVTVSGISSRVVSLPL